MSCSSRRRPRRPIWAAASGSRRSASGGRGFSSPACSPGGAMVWSGPKWARAHAAPGVSAIARRKGKLLASRRSRKSAISPASSPQRWATPVISRNRPPGASAATAGENRTHQSIRAVRASASASGSASSVARSGTRAVASVAFWPAWRPSFAAARLTAASRRTARVVSSRAKGASGGASLSGLRRRQFAIAQFGDQAQRIRDIAGLP